MKTIIERLLERSKLNLQTGCLEWQRGFNNKGYGNFVVPGRTRLVHRLMYEETVGSIPDGLFVCHRCDNPKCLNVEHLFLGTQLDNMRDAKNKNRVSSGDKHYSVLHPELVARGDRNGTHTCPEKLARGDAHYSRRCPELMARGDANGARRYPERICRGERCVQAKLTEQQVLLIRAGRENGKTYKELGVEYGISPENVYRISNRKSWKHVQ